MECVLVIMQKKSGEWAAIKKKCVFAVLLALIFFCSPVLGAAVFAFDYAQPGEVAAWNGPFEHETLAFYFPDPDVPELAVRGVRKVEDVQYFDGDDYYEYYWEFVRAPIVVIPDEVEGYPVTAVTREALAFQNEREESEIGMERIYVGKNVHVLGQNAFAGREVVIGKNELIAVYDFDRPGYDQYDPDPFSSANVHCYLDSDAYRMAREGSAIISLIDESHLVSDKVKIDEALNVYLPWGVTKETLGEYVSVDGDAKISILGDTIENGTQIELVNSTYGTIDNTYTVVLEKPQITLTVEPQRTVFAKTSFRLDAVAETTGTPCALTYTSDNADVAVVDDNGNVTTNKAGTARITVTATDKYGFAETAVCTVTVRYDWWQWLIRIFLLGWLWY